jgi:hypothetical protein
MATAQQPLSSKAAILLDLGLAFAGLGEEFLGVVAQGFGFGAFFGPAGFHGLARGCAAFFRRHVLRASLSTFLPEFGEVIADLSLRGHRTDNSSFLGGMQEIS